MPYIMYLLSIITSHTIPVVCYWLPHRPHRQYVCLSSRCTSMQSAIHPLDAIQFAICCYMPCSLLTCSHMPYSFFTSVAAYCTLCYLFPHAIHFAVCYHMPCSLLFVAAHHTIFLYLLPHTVKFTICCCMP